MQRAFKGGTGITSAGSAGTGKRRRWRPVAWATAAVMATGLSPAFATTAFATTTAASAGSDAPPAAGVAPGAYTSGFTRYVVYTGTDSGVWQKQVGSASPATSLGGRLISSPSPIDAATTRIVFGEGTDHALWEKVGNGNWTSLGGYLTSKPGAATISGTSYAVYVRGRDGAVWGRVHTSSGWFPWHSDGGAVLAGTGPSAAVNGYNPDYYILVAGTNHELFIHREGAMIGFVPAGGVTNSSPALVNDPGTGELVGFAQGTNKAGYFHRFVSSAPGWTSMGGALTSGMGGSTTDSPWYAYGLGTDNQAWEHAGLFGATGSWTRVTP